MSPNRSRYSRLVRGASGWMPVVLLLIVCGSIVALAGTGKLQLYIHPRYTAFAAGMAGIGVVIGVLALAVRRGNAAAGGDGYEHEHEHVDGPGFIGGHEPDPERSNAEVDANEGAIARTPTAQRQVIARARLAEIGRALGILTCVAVAAGMLLVPPASLSTRTTAQGFVGGGTPVGKPIEELEPGAAASLNTHELGVLIRQTTDVRSLVGEPVVVTGFVTADAEDKNLLHVTRFVIACCAVDAQPVGVPIRAPGWQAGAQWAPLADGDWVTVQGTLVANPGGSSLTALVVSPTSIVTIEEPKEPYEYE